MLFRHQRVIIIDTRGSCARAICQRSKVRMLVMVSGRICSLVDNV